MPRWLNPANLLTLVRLALAPFAIQAILESEYGRALALFALAGATDGIDGFLARRFGWRTRFGAYADPVADKVLLSAAYVALGTTGALPWWLVALVFTRDAFILAMAGYGLLFTPYRDFPPSAWGKLSTFAQITTAVLAMGSRAFSSAAMTRAAQALVWVAAAATLWSGVHYGWRGACLLRRRAAGTPN